MGMSNFDYGGIGGTHFSDATDYFMDLRYWFHSGSKAIYNSILLPFEVDYHFRSIRKKR